MTQYEKHPITKLVVNSKVADKVVKPAAHAVVAHTPEKVKRAGHVAADATKRAMTKPVYTEQDLEDQRIDATPEDGDGSIKLDAANLLGIIGIWVLVIGVVLVMVVSANG